MIRRLQVLNYRCLRYVDIALDRFHVLAGATASGRSTFLDVVAFLGDLIRDGPEAAVRKRSGDFRDLVWGRPADDLKFEIAAEFDVPVDVRQQLGGESGFRRFRYEIALTEAGGGPAIESERGILMPEATGTASPQESLFADPPPPPASVPSGGHRRGSMTVFSKHAPGNDSFNVESRAGGSKAWAVRIALGPRRSTLANLPDTPGSFPVATYIRDLLIGHVQSMAFKEADLRRPSAPGARADSLDSDGSNLPRVLHRFRKRDAAGYREWLSRLCHALPHIEDMNVAIRESDRHAILTARDAAGTELPSNVVSTGALRLAAFTLLPHLPATRGIRLIPFPESGLDAASLKVAYQALSRPANAQVLMATSSPALLGLANPEEILCCSRNAEGKVTVIAGNAHPEFEKWQGARDNVRLFAPQLLE
ncbi:MAG: hypothetical protein OXP09_04430 [Gammaproteobacteria bacterium]|nr:hypothetical protein [Gammaproteobacteria bacterium]